MTKQTMMMMSVLVAGKYLEASSILVAMGSAACCDGSRVVFTMVPACLEFDFSIVQPSVGFTVVAAEIPVFHLHFCTRPL